MQRLILFARRPALGRVKTRLAGVLSADRVLALYRAFVQDQVAFIASLGPDPDPELCWDTASVDPAATAETGAGAARVRQTLQGPGDLGARLQRAFARAADDGATAATAIGSDSPTLPVSLVEQALSALGKGTPAVIAPADDGGFVLLGLRGPVPGLLEEIDWGTERVFAQVRQAAGRCGLPLRCLDPWYDVDDDAGLRRLARELRDPERARRAPATARYLDALGRTSPGLLD